MFLQNDSYNLIIIKSLFLISLNLLKMFPIFSINSLNSAHISLNFLKSSKPCKCELYNEDQKS